MDCVNQAHCDSCGGTRRMEKHIAYALGKSVSPTDMWLNLEAKLASRDVDFFFFFFP